jgi:protocatechuate 3,4-dioxygenase alpha subunit
VIVEIWQADAAGHLDNPKFPGWGRAATDAQGVYRFRTVRPGAIPGRAPHINFLILYSGLMRQLQTVMFFSDAADPVLAVVKFKDRLIAKSAGQNRFRFDIRLRGGDETPFFDD